MICATVWVEDPVPMSTVPATICIPFKPRLWVSTDDEVRLSVTSPLVRFELPALVPKYTFRLLLKRPPVSSPIDCAWRSISCKSPWNSLFRVVRLPVNVPDADCVASVFSRSRI